MCIILLVTTNVYKEPIIKNNMKNNIKDNVETSIKKTKTEKKQTISFTLSKNTIKKLYEESKRLQTSSSFLVEMILLNYFILPIEKEEDSKKNK